CARWTSGAASMLSWSRLRTTSCPCAPAASSVRSRPSSPSNSRRPKRRHIEFAEEAGGNAGLFRFRTRSGAGRALSAQPLGVHRGEERHPTDGGAVGFDRERLGLIGALGLHLGPLAFLVLPVAVQHQ